MRSLSLRRLLPLLAPVVLALVLWFLYRELSGLDLRTVGASLGEISGGRLLAAIGLTLLSFLALSGYDTLGFRFVGVRVVWPRIALASFVGYAFSQALGHALLTGIPIRLRLYSAWGIGAEVVARVMAFGVLSSWLGQFALAGVFFVVQPLPLPGGLAPLTTRPLGLLLLAAVALYLVLIAGRREPLVIRGVSFALPGRRTALLQVLISSLEVSLASGVLFMLLPADAGLAYPRFLCAFLLANMLGMLSTLPSGIGVFDVTLILLLPEAPPAALVAAVLAYRGVFYLLPLLAAAVALGGVELHRHRQVLGAAGRVASRWNAAIAPQVLAAATFAVGVVLLVSGATPAIGSRIAALGRVLPLPVIETSHFLASLIGLALLILARGLQRRVRSAFHLAVGLMVLAIAASLLKGLDFEEATLLALMLLALIACRDRFDRSASIASARLTPAWVAMITGSLVLTAWLVFVSSRQLSYAGELWWRFALHGDAPRAMRAMVGVGVLGLAIAVARWLRPAVPEPGPPVPEALERAVSIAASSPRAHAQLVALGDKSILFDEAGQGFLMYAIEGRSWVAYGDPVAPESSFRELLWRFQGLAERAGGWPVFYKVGADGLGHYVDLGLSLLKLGEEGLVSLDGFSLEGGKRKELRQTVRKLTGAGLSFEVLPAAEVEAHLPRLKVISDAWLEDKNTREKGFSLGFFEESYLRRNPLAVVRSGESLLAFANVLEGGGKEELSIDLMRYVPEAPRGVMDYLFAQLMLWGAANDFRAFSMGMTPLAGLEAGETAPMWNRLGALVYRHGEHFYNFRGLRQYKEKFDPTWEARYLASPGGLALPQILTHVTTLISGGVQGIFTR